MSQYAYPETLVESQWLLEHLDDPNVRIIEMDLSAESYDKGHIPGSVFCPAMKPFKPDLRLNLELSAMEGLLGDLGINNNSTVVAVHNSYIGTSGFIFWLLKVLGHDDVRVLNGGSKKWLMDGYPITQEQPVITPTQYSIPSINHNLRVSLAELQTAITKNNCILLDVRTPQEYDGEIFMMNPPTENERAGHIPGAINLYYELAHNDDDTFKSYTELKEIVELKNINSDQLIIPYCAVGGRSAHTWFILKYLLGYPHVKNYDGSWNEWSRIADLPIEIK